jgi:hypothetical protein
MPILHGWDPHNAIASATPVAVRGEAFRAHLSSRDALDAQSYLYAEGRFNRGGPDLAEDERWAALYLSSAPHIALGEYTRHLPDLSRLRGLRITRIHVELMSAANCLDLGILGLSEDCLLGTTDDYSVGQSLAAAAIDAGYEAIAVPTATRFRGYNLVVFMHNLRAVSRLQILDFEEPQLYRERKEIGP